VLYVNIETRKLRNIPHFISNCWCRCRRSFPLSTVLIWSLVLKHSHEERKMRECRSGERGARNLEFHVGDQPSTEDNFRTVFTSVMWWSTVESRMETRIEGHVLQQSTKVCSKEIKVIATTNSRRWNCLWGNRLKFQATYWWNIIAAGSIFNLLSIFSKKLKEMYEIAPARPLISPFSNRTVSHHRKVGD
jgi:hypothetical protein